MEARKLAPYQRLLLAAALGLLSATAALSNDALANRPVPRTGSPDPRWANLQSLKQSGIFEGSEWDSWRAARREWAEQSRRTRTLDQGGENCASAVVIPAVPYTDSGTTSGAADDYNVYCPWEQNGGPDVVYQYTPAVDHSISVDLCEATFDSKLYVYAATCSGEPVACNEDACGDVWGYPWASRINCVPLSAGTTYYIVVDGFAEYELGDYVLHLDVCGSCSESPVHDLCENAKVVASFPYTDTDNSICAHHECGDYAGIYADVWYRFTLTQAGDVTINLCGTAPSMIFTATALRGCGGSCPSLITADDEEYVTCTDFNPTVRWTNVPPGTYYYPVLSLVASGQPYTININGPEIVASSFSGTITMIDNRPTNRRFRLTHESGEITWIGFTGLCDGTTGQVVDHAQPWWSVLTNGDGNDGDSIIFVTSAPLTAGSVESFVLRYPACTSDVHWVAGNESGVIPGLPPALKVHQNAPNPFNPSTTIRFDLSDAAHARVAVYNLMGQEVAVLMDEMAGAGPHSVEFEASDLTSGVYIYQIDIPGSQQRMKMLLVK